MKLKLKIKIKSKLHIHHEKDLEQDIITEDTPDTIFSKMGYANHLLVPVYSKTIR